MIVGSERDLAAPGAFFTHVAAGVPLLVARDPWGHVHAMVNRCRHRDVILVAESHGNRPQFVCAQHGWTYDTCGRMVPPGPTPLSLSRCDAERARDLQALVERPSERRHGLVWVLAAGHPARDAIDVASFLGGEEDEALASLASGATTTGDDDGGIDVRRELARWDASWPCAVEALLAHPSLVRFVFPGSFLLRRSDGGVEHVGVAPVDASSTAVSARHDDVIQQVRAVAERATHAHLREDAHDTNEPHDGGDAVRTFHERVEASLSQLTVIGAGSAPS